MRFWDASALVPLLVRQERSREMEELIARDPVGVIWWGTPVECLSAIVRLARDGHLGAEQVDAAERRLRAFRESWDEVTPGEACRRAAERMLRVHALRTADAFQLAAALIASDHDPDRLGFVCLDRRLAEAARREGFELPVAV